MGAVQKWVSGTVAVLSICGMAKLANAAEVTDVDRSYGNFVREAATVGEQQVRLEVRGLSLNDEGKTRIDIVGRRIKADSLAGGKVEALASYGVFKGSEIGIDVPIIAQSVTVNGQNLSTNGDPVPGSTTGLGDISLYWKFKQQVAEHCAVGAGVEVQTPSNTNDKIGTREVGLNGFVGTRYTHGAFGIGLNTGYQFFSGDVANVYNFGVTTHIKGGENWGLRTELVGRIFDQAGLRNHDVSILPGIDYNISRNWVFRPTGIVGITSTSLDWGIGAGLAATF